MRPFKSTISIDEARRLLREGVRPIERVDTVPLSEGEGRVAAADVQSTIEVPPFARSAMDGYAVVSRDLSGAGSARPVRLRIVDRIYTGQVPRTRVEAGTAIEIATGAPLPEGADAVVMVEETRRAGENEVEDAGAGGRRTEHRAAWRRRFRPAICRAARRASERQPDWRAREAISWHQRRSVRPSACGRARPATRSSSWRAARRRQIST